MILEAAWGLREIKKPLAVCGDTYEMNKKLLLFLFFFPKDKFKVKWDEIWTIIATRPDCVELDKFFFSKVECTGIPQLRPQREYIPLFWYVKNVPTVRTCHLPPRVSAQQQQQQAVHARTAANPVEDATIPQSALNQPNNWSVAFSSHLL